MIELLLIVIIVLICMGMFAYAYYALKMKKEIDPQPDLSCPACPTCPSLKCPKTPEYPKCPDLQCPPCPAVKDYDITKCPKTKDDGLTLGFSLKTKKKAIKKIIRLINEFNSYALKTYCINKQDLKLEISKSLDKEDLPDLPCDEFIRALRIELEKNIRRSQSNGVISEDIQVEALMTLIEIAEILVPDELCKDNKPNRKKMKKFLYNIIDAFCDGASGVVDDDESDDDESDIDEDELSDFDDFDDFDEELSDKAQRKAEKKERKAEKKEKRYTRKLEKAQEKYDKRLEEGKDVDDVAARIAKFTRRLNSLD